MRSCARRWCLRKHRTQTRTPAMRLRWARLLKRVFDIDIERCACGGKLKIIAAIEASDVIERMLTHQGLSGRPPPRAAARREELFEGA